MTACVECGRPFPLLVSRPSCPCGGLPAIPEPAAFDPRESRERRVVGVWRFSAALPLPPTAGPPLTHGEAAAALEPLGIDGAPPGLFALRADREPSGSSADAGAALLAGALRGAGARRLHVDDAFDHALALARYLDGSPLRVTATLPDSASEGHRALLERAGARLAKRGAALPAGCVDAHPARQPLAAFGAATLAFRIVERLGGQPGAVICAARHGTQLAGFAAGFGAMARAGVGPVPRLFGVQPTGCAPLAAAFARGDARAREDEPAAPSRGRLSGLGACARPLRDVEALAAALGSGGAIDTIDEPALERTVRLLWREGVKVEPWAALPFAWACSESGRARLAHPGPVVAIAAAHGVRFGVPLTDPFP